MWLYFTNYIVSDLCKQRLEEINKIFILVKFWKMNYLTLKLDSRQSSKFASLYLLMFVLFVFMYLIIRSGSFLIKEILILDIIFSQIELFFNLLNKKERD